MQVDFSSWYKTFHICCLRLFVIAVLPATVDRLGDSKEQVSAIDTLKQLQITFYWQILCQFLLLNWKYSYRIKTIWLIKLFSSFDVIFFAFLWEGFENSVVFYMKQVYYVKLYSKEVWSNS